MQHRHRQGRGDVEPDGHVNVLFAALDDGAQEVDGEGHPDDGDGDFDRPFQFRVFLAGGEAQRQRDGGGDDDRVPTPEVQPAQLVAEHAGLAEPLQRVIDAHEHAVAHEGEDHGIGVDGPQTAEGDELQVEVRRREKELDRAQQPGGHADDAPDDGGDGEGADNAVVVFECLHGVRARFCWLALFSVQRFCVYHSFAFSLLLVWSSMSGRREGVLVSSYCPDRTAHMNPTQKNGGDHDAQRN